MTAVDFIFGNVATREKYRRFLWIASVVIGLDLVTKWLALQFAPVDSPLKLWGGAIEIQLAENPTLLGSMQHRVGNLSQVLVSAMVTLVLSVGGWVITSARDRPMKKFVVVLGVLLGAWAGFSLPVDFLGASSARAVGVAHSFGVLMSSVLLLRIVLNKQLFASSALLVSANLANGLNSIWHPAGVIDFIWIRPLRRVMGIANVADWTMTLSSLWIELVLVLWVSVEFLCRLSPARPRRRVLRAFLASVLP